MSEKKTTKYLKYAIGEIVLVVIGILIAIQINEWNRERKMKLDELDSYQLIITDLKRDSTLFQTYQDSYNRYLDTYFELNNINNGNGSFKNIMPDFIVSNIEFNPVTKNNHQATIEKLRNSNIRDQINAYFRRLNQVQQANDEFNRLIEQVSRPFFLVEQDIFNNAVIFNNDDRTFPPVLRVSGIDTLKLKRSLGVPQAIPILSKLRMGMGFYLTSLQRSMQENHRLIQDLEKSLN
ncbi:MAG: hypothetical protein HKN96_11465 [Flavobacteriaceae bacterium]|nr:hypothetical protein [Flavobacteriaceae bacterium]